MTRLPSEPLDDDLVELIGSDGYPRVLAVNVDGVVFGVQALRSLIEPGGVVAVTALVADLTGLSFDPFYAMTKHALVGFVRSMVAPLQRDDIRINAFCPHGIDTAIVPDRLREIMPVVALHPPRDAARSLLVCDAECDPSTSDRGGHQTSSARTRRRRGGRDLGSDRAAAARGRR